MVRSGAGPSEVHVLVVDLRAPGVSIRCTPPRERAQTTSSYARNAHLAAAVNGGFWSGGSTGAEGLAAGAGVIWSSDTSEMGFFARLSDGRAMISRPSDVVEAQRRGITDAVSGRPLIVDRGRLADELYSFPNAYSRQPRTAAGVSQDGRTVYLVTVDGRRGTSHGMTLIELADLMVELGVYRGLNLDGGGSTTMFIAAQGGMVNHPSERVERVVMTHIGVVAPPPLDHTAPSGTARPASTTAPSPREGSPMAPHPVRTQETRPDAAAPRRRHRG